MTATMTPTKTNLTVLIAAIFFAGLLTAQDLGHKAAPQKGAIMISGATVHTVAGDVIERGGIVFRDGKIVWVGSGPPPAGVLRKDVRIIEAHGKHVYPGYVCAASAMGLTEIGAVDMTRDLNEAGALNPEVVAATAVNPDSWLIPVARRNGVLTCGVWPQGGLLSGRASVIRMDGWTWEDMAIDVDAGIVLSWPNMSAGSNSRRRGPTRLRRSPPKPEDILRRFDALFDAAAAYLAAKRHDETLLTDLRLEGFRATLEGKRPLLVQASRKAQIESAVHWATGRGLKLCIIGGREAAQCIELLKRHDVAVALTKAHRLPRRRDLPFQAPYELPSLLENAGVRWCLSDNARSAADVRNLPYEAAACVPHGLSKAAALRSITLSAAEFLGIADRLGSLEVGKVATLFIADGDPFELTTRIERAFIDGRAIDLDDKQTALRDKYREKYRQQGAIK
ncbi:MAG: amidohydrolase family protein [Planctomycetota bacterium]